MRPMRPASCSSPGHALAQHTRGVPDRLSTPLLPLARVSRAPKTLARLPLPTTRLLLHQAATQDPPLPLPLLLAHLLPAGLLRHLLPQTARAAPTRRRRHRRRLRAAADRALARLRPQHRRAHRRPSWPTRHAAPRALPGKPQRTARRGDRLRPLRDLRVHPGLSPSAWPPPSARAPGSSMDSTPRLTLASGDARPHSAAGCAPGPSAPREGAMPAPPVACWIYCSS